MRIHFFICIKSTLMACRASVCAGQLEQRGCSHLDSSGVWAAGELFEFPGQKERCVLRSSSLPLPARDAAPHPITMGCAGERKEEHSAVFVLQSTRELWDGSNPSAFFLCFQVWQRLLLLEILAAAAVVLLWLWERRSRKCQWGFHGVFDPRIFGRRRGWRKGELQRQNNLK